MSPPLALDTSVAVPLLLQTHLRHREVYDALVALAALEHGAVLATRDARARTTYERLGAQVVVAGES